MHLFGTIPRSLGMRNGHGQPAISLSRKFHGLVKLRLPLRFFLPFLTEVLRNPLPDMTNFEHCKGRLLKGRLPVCKETLIYLLIVWQFVP